MGAGGGGGRRRKNCSIVVSYLRKQTQFSSCNFLKKTRIVQKLQAADDLKKNILKQERLLAF